MPEVKNILKYTRRDFESSNFRRFVTRNSTKFLFFLRCCWWSPFYKNGLSTLLLHNDDGLSLHGLHNPKCPLFMLPSTLGFYRFMVILISLKHKIFENFWVERVIEMIGRITYIVHENELYSKIAHKPLSYEFYNLTEFKFTRKLPSEFKNH